MASSTSRIQHLKKRIRRKNLDAILISQPENRRYLSGYSATDHGIGESSGCLLVLRSGTPYLLTDFRFQEQAKAEVHGFTTLLYPKGLLKLLEKLLPQLNIQRLGFESSYTLFSTAEKLMQLGRRHGIEMVPTVSLVEKMRCIKSDEEIELIRLAVQLNEYVFAKVQAQLSSDLTEIDVALQIGAEMRKAGAERESFDTIVATGTAGSLPHAVPSMRKLQHDASLLIDMGLVRQGYCSDMTRTFCLGRADKRYTEIHRIVRKAQLAGIAAVRAGISGKVVDKAARQVIADAGYGKYFGHALGHGVGMAVHEEPRISARSSTILRAGMVITIEPGIYIPGWGGIRLENMVVVQEDGCEDLNHNTTWLDI